MKLLNYDLPEKETEYHRLYECMPSDTFRMLICGGSRSGKTNLLMNMLCRPLIAYNQLFLYAKSLEQDKYQYLIQTFGQFSKKHSFNHLFTSNDGIIPVRDLLDDGCQRVVIFDDYVCEKNQSDLIDYFIQGRHKKCSAIYISQSFYRTPKDIRLNCSYFCVYSFPSARERNAISNELNVTKERYRNATREPYSFLYVDLPAKRVAKNFDEEIR